MASSSLKECNYSINTDIKSQMPEEEESFGYAMQLAIGSVLPMAMNAAIHLGVFDILAKADDKAALSAEEIVARMPTNNPNAPAMLKRICRLLVDHCVLGHSMVFTDTGVQWLYCLTPVSKYFLRFGNGVSLAPLMNWVHDKVSFNRWSQLKDAVLEGGVPFDRAHGMNFYKYVETDAGFHQIFKTAMFNHTAILVKKILESYDGLEKLKKVVDVGGGVGMAISLITYKYPKIKGINFDLPDVIEHAQPIPRVKHEAGDMFERVPKGDAIFLKWILHEWSDDRCLKLLKNCYEAIPIDGKVIVVEQVLSNFPENTTSAKGKSQLDVLMMTQNEGGKERTQHEISRLAAGAGFKNISFALHVFNTWVMEFKK